MPILDNIVTVAASTAASDFLGNIATVNPPRAKANDFINIIRDIRGDAADLILAAQDPNCIYGDIVTKYIDFIGKYDIIGAEINAVFADLDAIITVNANKLNIDTVAAADIPIRTVAGIAVDVSAVAADHDAIVSIYTDKAAIDAVYAKLSDVVAVAADIASVVDVSANMADVKAAVSVAAAVSTVAGIHAEIAALGSEPAYTALLNAEANANSAHADALLTAADVVSTNADAVSTGIDAANAATSATTSGTNATTATTARVGAEAAQTAAESARDIANADVLLTHADVVSTGEDATTSGTNAINALTSEQHAAVSATNASTSETNASSAATASNTSAVNAATSEASASISASNASTSEANASTSESNASTLEGNASTSAGQAASSASAASTSASNASTSETNAHTSEVNAKTSETFVDNLFLGSKTSDPTTDNNSGVLQTGAMYYNIATSGSEQIKIWDGAAWQVAVFNASGAVTSFNGRGGAVTLSAADINTALGFTAIEYTQAEKDKLAGIENGATADQTKADIDLLGVDSATVTGNTVGTNVPVGAVFTDTVYDDTAIRADVDANTLKRTYPAADETKLAGVEVGATGDQTLTELNALGIDSATVTGNTVGTAVPAGAVFTDTVYDDTSIQAEVTANTAKRTYPLADETKLSGVESGATTDQTKSDIDVLGINAATVNSKTVETSVPAGAVFTDTVYNSTSVDSHMADTTIHFTKGSLDGILLIGEAV